MTSLIAAIDQGTTGSRCLFFDTAGQEVSRAYEEHAQIFPRPGWVEHDPQEILTRVLSVTAQAMRVGQIKPDQIRAIGIANQRETVVAWDARTGRPLCNAIVWQCMRTRQICQNLLDRGLESLLRDRTGLVVATYFAAPKMQWLLENVSEVREAARRGCLMFGTIDSWLIWNLTGGPRGGAHVTDVTNASRTMLMDLQSLDWDPQLLALFGIPRESLPTIRPSSDGQAYGCTLPDSPFGAGIPICGALGDQQAALVGQACFEAGEAKNTYGTGSFMLMHTGQERIRSESGLLTTVAYRLGDAPCTYALEGSIAITGAAVQWLRDNLGLIESAAESEAVAASVQDTGGVYFVPAFSGLFAPHWDMDARGVIVGLTRYATKAHLVRATLEAICYQTREVLDAMVADSGIRLRQLKVDGGAVANDLLMQLQADTLGTRVVRPTVQETTALGAAYAAGLAMGVWPGVADLRGLWGVDAVFEPEWDESRRSHGYAGWKRAVERAKGWAVSQSDRDETSR